MLRKMTVLCMVLFTFMILNTLSAFAGDGHNHKECKQSASKMKNTYPLDTCPVTGAKLGSMGDGVTYTYKGQEIRLCCEGCLDVVKKNPEKYLKIIEDAKKKSE